MKLLWLDFETTGLDPQRDHILEVYAARTDLNTPFEIETEVWHTIGFRGTILDKGVRDMHEASGLLADVAESNLSVDRAEDQLLDIVPDVTEMDERTTLAGRSVHFDLGFVRVHMPWLAKRLHYRVLDVSGVEVFLRTMGMPRLPKGKAHRAKADVEESIRHAQMCASFIRSLA